MVNSQYYAFAVREMARSQWIQALTKGIRERSTDFRFEGFGSQLVPYPPLPEQLAIVRFLTHADRRIRRYIRAKQRLIKLLEEQKQAIIHRAVTRGLDPNVRLKPSGVEWLGDVPEHWEIKRAKTICSAIVDCKNRTPDAIDGGRYLVVRTTCVRNGEFDSTGGYATDEQNFRTWTARGAPQLGDVFFTREAPAGEACLVPDRADVCMGQRMMYFRPDPELLDPDFLLLSIYGPLTRTYVELATTGSTVGHLRLGQVNALPILWCSLDEQREIVRYVGNATKGLEHSQSSAKQEITFLRELRTRLIADVVTGKLDVREAAALLPDEPDDLDTPTDLPEASDEVGDPDGAEAEGAPDPVFASDL
jgi:type I restriction enzyme S subunit